MANPEWDNYDTETLKWWARLVALLSVLHEEGDYLDTKKEARWLMDNSPEGRLG